MAETLADLKRRVSTNFVTLVSDELPPVEAIQVFSDSGKVFAIVPVSSLDEAQLEHALPALTQQDSGAFEALTGAVILRWSGDAKEVISALQAEGLELVRNYGVGGVVVAIDHVDLFDLVERLSTRDFVISASLHTLQQASSR